MDALWSASGSLSRLSSFWLSSAACCRSATWRLERRDLDLQPLDVLVGGPPGRETARRATAPANARITGTSGRRAPERPPRYEPDASAETAVLILSAHGEVRAAVLGEGLLRCGGVDRALLAERDRRAAGRRPRPGSPGSRARPGALVAEGEVVLDGAALVAVPFDRAPSPRAGPAASCACFSRVARASSLSVGLVVVEVGRRRGPALAARVADRDVLAARARRRRRAGCRGPRRSAAPAPGSRWRARGAARTCARIGQRRRAGACGRSPRAAHERRRATARDSAALHDASDVATSRAPVRLDVVAGAGARALTSRPSRSETVICQVVAALAGEDEVAAVGRPGRILAAPAALR